MLVMTELIDSPKVLKVYPSFILGKCNCGCNEDIPIRSTGRTLAKCKKGHNFVGKNNPGFNNGVSNNREYGLIRDFNHPNCNKVGYVPLHVYNFTVRNGKLFCCMLKWGVVHHIIPKNQGGSDELENLQGLTQKQHGKHHWPKKDHSQTRCIYPDCKTPEKTLMDPNGSPHWYNWNGGFICHRCFKRNRYSKS